MTSSTSKEYYSLWHYNEDCKSPFYHLPFANLIIVIRTNPLFAIGKLIADQIHKFSPTDKQLIADHIYVTNHFDTISLISNDNFHQQDDNYRFDCDIAGSADNTRYDEEKYSKLFIADSIVDVLGPLSLTEYDLSKLVDERVCSDEQMKTLIALENAYDLSSLRFMARFDTFLTSQIYKTNTLPTARRIANLQYLLDRGADPNKLNNQLETPFIVLCYDNFNSEIFKFLIDLKVDVMKLDCDECCCLIDLCRWPLSATADDFKYLFEHSNISELINKSTCDYYHDGFGGGQPFSFKPLEELMTRLDFENITTEQIAIIKLFLEYGANPNIKQSSGNSIVRYAIQNNDIFDLFLTYGAKVDILLDKNCLTISAIISEPESANFTLLHEVCQSQCSLADFDHRIRKLVQLGLNINATDNKGITPLMDLFAHYNYYHSENNSDKSEKCEILISKMHILLELSADINIRDAYNRNIIYFIMFDRIGIDTLKHVFEVEQWHPETDFLIDIINYILNRGTNIYGYVRDLYYLNINLSSKILELVDYVIEKFKGRADRMIIVNKWTNKLDGFLKSANLADVSSYPLVQELNEKLLNLIE